MHGKPSQLNAQPWKSGASAPRKASHKEKGAAARSRALSFAQWPRIYFFFCLAACGRTSGRGINMCERAASEVPEEPLCATSTPVETWPESDSMNGKVVPSTLYKVRPKPPFKVPFELLVPLVAEMP